MSPLLLLAIGIIIVIGGILLLKLHPVLALLTGALVVGGMTSYEALEHYAVAQGLSPEATEAFLHQSLGKRVAVSFGNTCAKVGLLIALASIIGKCLLETGAAERIVRGLLALLGNARASLSFLFGSFILAIPVYFDTVFYLMIPIARTMGVRFQKSYALYVMGILAGGAMAHSLVPPTPGPLFVAGELGVGLGTMIVVGSVVGLISASIGMLYGVWINRRRPAPLRDTTDTSVSNLKAWASKNQNELPSMLLSLAPIVLPIIFIAGDTILSNTLSESGSPVITVLKSFLHKAGDPVLALFVATVIAIAMLVKQLSGDLKAMKAPLQEALYSAGIIILITATGGAFGSILQQTGIGDWLASVTPDYKLAVLPLAFLVTSVMRTAQGSATVAMITAVGIIGGVASQGALPFHPVYLAIAIGCGSKPFPWMNDSGFWIVCKMSGFTEKETIRYFSVLLTIMGISGLAVTMVLASLIPMI